MSVTSSSESRSLIPRSASRSRSSRVSGVAARSADHVSRSNERYGDSGLPAGWTATTSATEVKRRQSAMDFTSGQMAQTHQFWVMYVMMTLVATGGLMATAQLNPMAVDFKVEVPGTYMLVDHALSRAARGLIGQLIVVGDPQPEIFKPNEAPEQMSMNH